MGRPIRPGGLTPWTPTKGRALGTRTFGSEKGMPIPSLETCVLFDGIPFSDPDGFSTLCLERGSKGRRTETRASYFLAVPLGRRPLALVASPQLGAPG